MKQILTSNIKIIISVLLIVGAYLIFGVWYHGTKKSLKENPTYGKLIDKKYITLRDLYVSQYKDSGSFVVKIPGSLCPEIHEIEKFPCERVSSIIHKVIPEGSIFTITEVVVTNKPFRGTDIWLKAHFDDEKIFKGEIGVTLIANSMGGYTEMDSRYVEEITSEGELENE